MVRPFPCLSPGMMTSGGYEDGVLAQALGIGLGHVDRISFEVCFGMEHRCCGCPWQRDEALDLLRFPTL